MGVRVYRHSYCQVQHGIRGQVLKQQQTHLQRQVLSPQQCTIAVIKALFIGSTNTFYYFICSANKYQKQSKIIQFYQSKIMKNIFFVYLFLLTHIAYSQSKSTYIGTSSDGKKVLVSIKFFNNVVVGAFYENNKNNKNIYGNLNGSEFSGTINYFNMNMICTGEVKNDSLVFKIYPDSTLADKFISYHLVKSPKLLALEQYFGLDKISYPTSILGKWKLATDYDVQTKQYLSHVEGYDELLLTKNGGILLLGDKAGKVSPMTQSQIGSEWYTIDDGFFIKLKIIDLEITLGKFLVKNDTLTFTKKNIVSTLVKVK
jgi:hypothetical protein